MRDVLIVSIVFIAAIMALKRPWIGVMLWTWLSIMNPHRFTWGFAYSAPLAAIAAVVTIIGLLFTRERQSPFQGGPVIFFAIFILWMTLSWFFGMDPTGDYGQWDKVMKIYFMTFIAIMLLQTKLSILAFSWVTVGSLALLGAKGGVFTILHGGNYRVWGPPGSFIEDNNALALALIVIVPLLHFLQLQVQNKWVQRGISITMLLCVASSLGSHSRGAFLAIIAMGSMFWWRSRRKGYMGVMIVFALLVILPIMPQEWWNRMETIETYQQDASAIGRLNGWYVAWEVAKHHFFGGGMSYQHQLFFSLYGLYNTNVIAAHSIYFQILGNHGFIGLFLYLMIWFSTYHCAGWLRKNADLSPETRWAYDLGSMAQVSLIGYAVGGAFLSLAYFDLPYNIMVMVVLAKKWVETRSWEREPQLSFLEYAGLRRRKSNIDVSVGVGQRSASIRH